jgi:hypothetical protein
MRISLSGAALALAAMFVPAGAGCGGGTIGSGNTGTGRTGTGNITGTIGGYAYTVSSTISLEPTKGPQGGSAGIAAIVFSNRSPLCGDLEAGKVPGGLQFFLVQLSDNYRSAPTAPGTYQVTTGYGGPPKAAVIVAGVDDAQCLSVPSSVALGVSGTVELTRIDNGAYAITFDVVMQTRSGATDHVTGWADSVRCDSLGKLGFWGGESPSCG